MNLSHFQPNFVIFSQTQPFSAKIQTGPPRRTKNKSFKKWRRKLGCRLEICPLNQPFSAIPVKHPTSQTEDQRHPNSQHLLMLGSSADSPLQGRRHIRQRECLSSDNNDIYHHDHRQLTLIMETSHSIANEGRHDDRLDNNDIPSEHPGTKTSESPSFHMVAEPCACPSSRTMSRSDDIDPSSSTSRLRPTPTSLPLTSAHLFEHHCHRLPRSQRLTPTTSPSLKFIRRTSAGVHGCTALDAIYDTHRQDLLHQRGASILASGCSSHSLPTSSPRYAVTAAATTAAAAATAASSWRPVCAVVSAVTSRATAQNIPEMTRREPWICPLLLASHQPPHQPHQPLLPSTQRCRLHAAHITHHNYWHRKAIHISISRPSSAATTTAGASNEKTSRP